MRHLAILRFLSILLPLLASCAAGSTARRTDPANGQPAERRAVLSTGIDARWIEVGDPRGVPVLFLHGYWFVTCTSTDSDAASNVSTVRYAKWMFRPSRNERAQPPMTSAATDGYGRTQALPTWM